MELRHLRYFLAAAEEENFGRAARRLNLAQPALSRQIRDLEQELGAGLFERIGRGVRLSAAGAAFAEEARLILDAARAAADRARAVARGEEGTLRLGFLDSSAWGGEVPALLRRFRAAAPAVRLDLTAANSIEQLAAIAAGGLDAGFVYRQDGLPPGLAMRPIRADGLVAAIPRGHALAAGQGPIPPAALAGEPFVWFPRAAAPAYHDRAMAALAAIGLAPRVVQEAVTDSLMLSLVSAGVGVSLVNTVARWRCPEGVALRPVAGLDLKLHLDLVWRQAAVAPALARFLALAEPSPPARRSPAPAAPRARSRPAGTGGSARA
jgi:DNA-binding transcriptional LysR family regulator